MGDGAALFPRVPLEVYDLSPCRRAELDWNVGRSEISQLHEK